MERVHELTSRDEVIVRRARTPDVRTIKPWSTPTPAPDTGCWRRRPSPCTKTCRSSGWPTVAGEVIGCGALHVLWEDLAEVRTLASTRRPGHGVGHRLVWGRSLARRGWAAARLLPDLRGRFLRPARLPQIRARRSQPEVYAELLPSSDEGVAEFLDLARVKPNTLGNARMLLHLASGDQVLDQRER